MDKPISAGDMVFFVRACCSLGAPYLGMVYQVERIQGKFPGVYCDGCNTMHTGTKFARFKLHQGSKFTAYIPPKWLKRIPPLGELESTKTEEKLYDLA